MIISSIIGIRRNQWIIVWICLEINSLSICFILRRELSTIKKRQQSTIIYLIIQIITSIIILFVSIKKDKSLLLTSVIIISIIIKIGAWPLHPWFLKIITKIKITQKSITVLITWQKILPIVILSIIYHTPISPIMLVFIAVLRIITPTSNLKSTSSTKRVITLSSINNNGWIIIGILRSIKVFFLFFCAYSSALWVILKFSNLIKSKNIKIWENFYTSIIVIANIRGLPPLTIFWAKVIILIRIILIKIPSEIYLLILIVTVYFLYHYLWIILKELTKEPKKSQKIKNSKVLKNLNIRNLIFSFFIFATCFWLD